MHTPINLDVSNPVKENKTLYHPRPEYSITRSWPFSITFIPGFVMIADGLVLFFTGTVGAILYLGWDHPKMPVYALLATLGAVLTTSLLYFSHNYKVSSFKGHQNSIRNILLVLIISFFAILCLVFAFKISDQISRVWFFAWFSSGMLLLVFERAVIYALMDTWAHTGRLSLNTVIVGATKLSERLLNILEHSKDPWVRIFGIFDERQARVGRTVCQYPLLGDLDDLIRFARTHRVDDIIIALPGHAEHRLLAILAKLDELPVRIYLCPEMVWLNFHGCSYDHFAGIPLLAASERPLSGWNYIAKMIEDRVLAAIFLLLTLPAMVLIAACIKLNSRGPVFFRQQRYGFNHRAIEVLKFRTLRVEDQDNDARCPVTRNDPRVTRVGAVLRRYSLDELPQFINVLRGEMSIVGPRPHVFGASLGDDLFENVVNKYAARHKVKPGMTGWAQINGWRGEINSVEKLEKRVEHDMYYIQNCTLMLDLIIIMRTFWAVFRGNNSY